MAPQPQVGKHIQVAIVGKVLVVTLARPKKLNSINNALQADLEKLLDWYEDEPSLWCLIVTGTSEGRNAFCAGMDLAETLESEAGPRELSRHGFASLSRRYSTKPFICAVNGICLGGGLEVVMNADIVIAAETAKMGFPEVTRGVTAAQGGIPRAAAICGHIRAAELLLTGRIFSAKEGKEYGFVTELVSDGKALSRALEVANQICTNSPDAVQLTKLSLEHARRVGCNGVEKATIRALESEAGKGIWNGENLREGLTAFAERRKPEWRDAPVFKAKL